MSSPAVLSLGRNLSGKDSFVSEWGPSHAWSLTRAPPPLTYFTTITHSCDIHCILWKFYFSSESVKPHNFSIGLTDVVFRADAIEISAALVSCFKFFRVVMILAFAKGQHALKQTEISWIHLPLYAIRFTESDIELRNLSQERLSPGSIASLSQRNSSKISPGRVQMTSRMTDKRQPHARFSGQIHLFRQECEITRPVPASYQAGLLQILTQLLSRMWVFEKPQHVCFSKRKL